MSTADQTLVRYESEQTEQAIGQARRGVQVNDNGDVEFWALAVDHNKTPNRKGLLFRWPSPDKVNVENLKANPALLYMHDSFSLTIGHIEQIDVTKTQVWMRCVVSGDYPETEPIRQRIINGDLRAVSIGFYITESVEKGKGDQVWLEVLALEPVELSVVTIGAHETALIKQAAEANSDGAAMPTRFHWDAETSDKGTLYRLSLDVPAEDAEAGQQDAEQPETQAADTEDEQLTQAIEEGRVTIETDSDGNVLAASVDAADAPPAGPVLRLDGADWPTVAQTMAKLLGARGGMKLDADERERAYAELTVLYAEHEQEPPALQEYDKDGLAALHEAGQIIIPGVPEPEQAETQTEAGPSPVEAMQAQIQALTEQVEELTAQLETERKLRVEQEVAAAAEEPPHVDPVAAENALRQMVDAALKGSPELLAKVDRFAEAVRT